MKNKFDKGKIKFLISGVIEPCQLFAYAYEDKLNLVHVNIHV